MDTSGFSQVGRYGTISLMKRNEPTTAITAFGIDSEELTFGRDPTCSVRLYYPDVSLVHCKIVFEERKAFLVVLGTNGLLVDGCKVYANSSPSHAAMPTTIPLSNNSDFEIHGKRFRFTYPPKELRAALMATPVRPGHRALRLSMIHSAQVFSPRPSQDPRENLRILRSPLKNAFKSSAIDSPSMHLRTIFATTSQDAYTTPAKHRPASEEDEEEDHIILVDGNHPRVVEEDKDLVILEDIEVPHSGIGSPTSSPIQPHSPPSQSQVQFQTPARQRSLSRNTLHRAVLIRSAQRAALKAESAEREREQEEQEEQEEMEVLGAVAADVESESENDDDVVMHDKLDEQDAVEWENGDENEGEEGEEGEEYDNGEEEEERGRARVTSTDSQKSAWRKSLERIWPFRSSSPGPKEEVDEGDENAATDSEDDSIPDDYTIPQDYNEEDENHDTPAPLPPRADPYAAMQTPIRKPLGSFMTPQVYAKSLHSSNTFAPAQDVDVKPQPGRYSLGGGEARRVVKAEQVWRVRDIVVPLVGSTTARNTPGPETKSSGPGVPRTAPNMGTGASAIGSPARRQVVGDEERKAIQERRRSALRGVDTFFPGGVPGMGPPSTPIRAVESGSSPAKSSSSFASSSKPSLATKRDEKEKDDEEQLDTKSLLERMKETVEGMKRRRSLAPATPVRGGAGAGLGPGGLATPARVGPALPRLAFGRGANPKLLESGMAGVEEVDENEKDEVAEPEGKLFSDKTDDEKKGGEEKMFSLLRPGVMGEVRTREEEPVEVPEIVIPDGDIANTKELVEMATSDPVAPLPVAAEDDAEINVAPKRGTRARLLRGTKPSPSPAPHGGDNTEEESVDQNINANAKGRGKSRADNRRIRTPQLETPQEQAEVEEHEVEPAHLARSTTRRTRTPTVEPEPEENQADSAVLAPVRRSRRAATAEPEEPTVAAAPAPRRGRKLTVEPEGETAGGSGTKKGRKAATAEPEEVEETLTPLPAPAKRGARKVAAPASEKMEEVPQPQLPVRRGRTPRVVGAAVPTRTATRVKNEEGVGASGAKRGMKAKVAADNDVIHDDDKDSLDTIELEETEPAAAIPKSKGRKRAVAVKEEVEDENNETLASTTRSTKAKNTSLKSTTARARGAAKMTPATAPPALIPQGVDKENTPGSEESSSIDLEDPDKVKVRVSKTTRKAVSGTATSTTTGRAKVKQDAMEDAPEPEAPRARVIRATRARTRT